MKKSSCCCSSELALLGGPKTVTVQDHQPYPVIGAEEVALVVRTVMNRHLSETGRAGIVGEMEDKYADYFGSRYCHAFNSGTAAIASALFAVGVGPGVEVLTASNTWISAICAIMHAGGTPVFCDTSKHGFGIDPQEIRRKAGPHTRAVIVTHIWGLPVDMDPILKVCRELKLAVIEDVSHAHGGRYKGKYLGTLGDVGCFSLQGSKSIVAGEGGFLLTDNKRYYERSMIPGDHGVAVRRLVTMPELEPFKYSAGGWTYRIAPVSAAIAVAQLDRLGKLTAIRQANFDRLYNRLRKTVPFIHWPGMSKGTVRGWYGTAAIYAYDTRKVSRDVFVAACGAEGAGVWGNQYANYYTTPLFQDLNLYGQLWPVRHANGVEFRPVKPGGLPHTDELLSIQLTFMIPHWDAALRMDQTAEAIEKVAAQMDKLVGYKPPQLAKGGSSARRTATGKRRS